MVRDVRRRTLAVAGLAAVACVQLPGVASAAPASTPAATASVSPGATRLMVGWVTGVAPGRARALLAAGGLIPDGPPSRGAVTVVSVPDGVDAEMAARALRARPEVAYVESDVHVTALGGDPYVDRLWGLDNTGQDGGLAGIDLDAPAAWSTSRGDGVVVAVLDEGVDIDHEDLSANIWTNPGEIPDNGIDDDGNGYVDNVHGWDFLHDDATVFDPRDGDAHGTHVAGTIAAVAGNGRGISGVAPGVTIMPLKFLGPDGGSAADAVAALQYAVAEGADIVNVSWGGPEYSQALHDAVAASGLLVVAAAGNAGSDNDATPVYPASFDLDNVLSVTAVDRQGRLPAFANHGARSVDVGAPGRDILSTLPGNTYGWASGTSMAAPHASGVAALVAAADPTRSPAAIARQLIATVTPLPSLARQTSSGGMLSAAAAVGAPPGADAPPVQAAPVSAAPTGEACGDGTVQAASYVDVAVGGTHSGSIGCVTWWGVASGSSDGTFAPEQNVTRAQMASFLANVVALAGPLPAPSADHFTDDTGSVHASSIDVLADLGLVAGVAPGRFDPGRPITRAQFATQLVAAYRWLGGAVPSAPGDAFVDDDGSVHEVAIDAATALGLVAGTSPGHVDPAGPVSRAQMATFLTRLLDRLVSEQLINVPGTSA